MASLYVVSMLHTQHIHKKTFCFLIAFGELEKKGPDFFFRLRRKKDAQSFFSRAAKNIARPKSRLAAAVAQNGYVDPDVAPAQQRNSYLMPWYPCISATWRGFRRASKSGVGAC